MQKRFAGRTGGGKPREQPWSLVGSLVGLRIDAELMEGVYDEGTDKLPQDDNRPW